MFPLKYFVYNIFVLVHQSSHGTLQIVIGNLSHSLYLIGYFQYRNRRRSRGIHTDIF